MSDFLRAELSAIVELQADTMVGSGQMVQNDEAKQALCCVDHQQNPFIPGSSFRGLLRKQLEQIGAALPLADQQAIGLLLGVARPEEKTKPQCTEQGAYIGAGRMQVFDLLLHGDTLGMGTRFHSSINPVTDTTQLHHLYNREVVKRGTQFALILRFELVSKRQLDLVYAALNTMTTEQTLGAAGNAGYGVFSIRDIQICKLEQESLCAWLKQTVSTTPPKMDEYNPSSIEADNSSGAIEIKLNITPQQPLIVHDAWLHQLRDKEAKARNQRCPDIMAQRTRQRQLKVPGSAVKGMLRARLRKILLTMAWQANSGQVSFSTIKCHVDSLVEQLFGSTKRKGWVQFSDWLSPTPARFSEQMFNAVDRFTGGVADSALYQVEHGYAELLEGSIRCHAVAQLPDWAIAAMLLLARDAIEGDLSIGWGKRKGFGQIVVAFSVADKQIDSVEELRLLMAETRLKFAFDALKQAVNVIAAA